MQCSSYVITTGSHKASLFLPMRKKALMRCSGSVIATLHKLCTFLDGTCAFGWSAERGCHSIFYEYGAFSEISFFAFRLRAVFLCEANTQRTACPSACHPVVKRALRRGINMAYCLLYQGDVVPTVVNVPVAMFKTRRTIQPCD